MRNRNRNVGARYIAQPELPGLDQSVSPEWLPEGIVQEIIGDPAFLEIARALACARYLNLDLQDLDVVRNAIGSGRRHHITSSAIPHKPRPRRRGLHEPIIYYMGLGDLVKIGTSTNIITRHSILGCPRVLAIERGDVIDERARHQFFGLLRVHGEWFRYEDPLMSYIWTVAEAFYADFGTDLETWLKSLRDGSRFRLPRVT